MTNFSDGHRIGRMNLAIRRRAPKRTHGSFNFVTGLTHGDPVSTDADVIYAIAGWVATHDGKAKLRRVTDRRGVTRLELTASIIEPLHT